MAIRYRAGRWPAAEILLAQHEDLARRVGAQPLDISAAAAVRAGSLDWDYADPFDRMLAAKSLLHHAALVTRDVAFRDLRGLGVVWSGAAAPARSHRAAKPANGQGRPRLHESGSRAECLEAREGLAGRPLVLGLDAGAGGRVVGGRGQMLTAAEDDHQPRPSRTPNRQ